MKMRLQLAVIHPNMGICRENEDVPLKSESVWRKSTKRYKERLIHTQKSHEWRKALLFEIILNKMKLHYNHLSRFFILDSVVALLHLLYILASCTIQSILLIIASLTSDHGEKRKYTLSGA